MKAIEVKNLTRTFGHVVAVDHISFEVEEGEIFGFLGANGAGKTTTIMMLTTALNPTSGNATVCGHDIVKDRNELRKYMAVVFEELSLDTDLTARENLDFHARMYHIPRRVREERVSRALELVGLKGKQNMLVKHYSGGMQRRLEIARAMVNQPRILFLDEPTLGLDVQTRRMLWDYARKLNRESGTTVLLTTHYVEEADYLCDRLAILEQGKILVTDTPEGLKSSLGDSLLSVKLLQGADELAKLLREVNWVKKVNQRDGWLDLSVESGETKIPEVARLAKEHGFAISSVSQHKPSLEDAFLHYAAKKLEDKTYE
ncbi:MAG: ABC transporter ATP-binding protein [Chloroflexi bacterium CG15_BIG_FIL_POST_REV_8_21_14_020_46_15]|nr:MAG: ABC transporter ATP-binding protein [Chloroflexi bacterium CG15_BIG_FIL_POST_REV_8_21_14_020_46_15]